MDLVGKKESAARFHKWSALVVNDRAEVIEKAIKKAKTGEVLQETDTLHARYSLDGQDTNETWPNFQLDGLGTWLWSLKEHQNFGKLLLPDTVLLAVERISRYLTALWHLPCYDCWEEFPDKRHTYTLAAIYVGLEAASNLAGLDNGNTLEQIVCLIKKSAESTGFLPKYKGGEMVDASLLGVAVPYKVINPDDALMRATVNQIENNLKSNGGVYRYSDDTYYGGGEWIILAAWLGWYYACTGQKNRAQELLSWIKDQADEEGNLPEQVSDSLLAPGYYNEWVRKWGKIAKPLLWSHAMYIILHKELLS